MNFKPAILLAALGFAALNASACYTVYGPDNRVVYQGTAAPVDMSLPVQETLGRTLPGAHMVFDLANRCTPVGIAQVSRTAGPGTNGPLLTDRRTAERMGLPHTPMSGEIVMVPSGAARANSGPGVTVVPAVVSALPALPAREQTVITEMRNPAVTITQRGDTVVLSQN